MVNLRNIYNNFKSESSVVGTKKAITSFGYQVANKFVNVRRFEIVALERENLLPLDLEKYSNISSRLATEEDLNRMEEERKWQMTKELRKAFQDGDRCLLSFVDNNLAGYTWLHIAGRPRLIPGLRISIPEEYGYNYAGFTLPEYRGIGLQPYRHHEVLNRPELSDKLGVIGYVDTTNWSSKKGQSKSGYQRVGDLVLIGKGDNLKALFSNELKKMGIGRLDD